MVAKIQKKRLNRKSSGIFFGFQTTFKGFSDKI